MTVDIERNIFYLLRLLSADAAECFTHAHGNRPRSGGRAPQAGSNPNVTAL
jgi:hypothetical protein